MRRPRAREPGGPVFVDSSGWLAILSASDRHHVSADAALRRLVAGRVRLVTSSLLLAETHRLVLHRVGIAAARAALDRIGGSAHVDLIFPTREHHAAALDWLAKLDDQAITYADATSFAIMRSLRIVRVLGLDRDFATAGFELIVR